MNVSLVDALINERKLYAREVERLRAEVERLRADAERLSWVLPILCGVDSDEADRRALRLGGMLLTGLDGVAAVDAAMAES